MENELPLAVRDNMLLDVVLMYMYRYIICMTILMSVRYALMCMSM